MNKVDIFTKKLHHLKNVYEFVTWKILHIRLSYIDIYISSYIVMPEGVI